MSRIAHKNIIAHHTPIADRDPLDGREIGSQPDINMIADLDYGFVVFSATLYNRSDNYIPVYKSMISDGDAVPAGKIFW
jgi:hypothetical protein